MVGYSEKVSSEHGSLETSTNADITTKLATNNKSRRLSGVNDQKNPTHSSMSPGSNRTSS